MSGWKRVTFLVVLVQGGLAAAARPKLSAPPSWPPEVRAAYQAVLATPAGAPGKSQEVANRVLALARTGAAHDAMGTLAFNDALPESHRAIAAIWFAQYYRFDPAGLLQLAEDANPFLARQAIDQLVALGGSDLSAKLGAIAARNPKLAGAIRTRLARMPATGKPPFVLAQLNTLLRGKKSKARSLAAVALSQSKDEAAEWGLQLLMSTQVAALADKDTQIFGALGLTRRHERDVPGLLKLAARGNNKFVRFEALKLLAKTPDGKKAMRALTLTPDDPMAKERDQLAR